MTLKQLEKKIQDKGEENADRGGLVALMCLKRGITDEDVIAKYIVKSYTERSMEFPNRKLKTMHYAQKSAKKSINWLKSNNLIGN